MGGAKQKTLDHFENDNIIDIIFLNLKVFCAKQLIIHISNSKYFGTICDLYNY